MQGLKLNKDIYMLYFYEIKETEQGFIGDVPDLEMETIEFKTKEEVVDALNKGLSTFIEMAYRQNNKRIPLPTTREFKKGDHYLYIPIKYQLRISLWNTMYDKHIRLIDLAKMLNVSRAQVQKFFGDKITCSVEFYEEALKVLNTYPTVKCISR